MPSIAREPVYLDEIDLAPPEQRLAFLRAGRDTLRTGILPDGQPLAEDKRDTLAEYVRLLAEVVRPRRVAGTAVL